MKLQTRAIKPSHLSLGVSDLDASERFYGDVLGLPASRRDGEVFIEWPDFLLVLTEAPPAARGKFHFGFRVENGEAVDAWAARIKEAGGEILAGPDDRDEGRAVFFNDPDQYVLEIYSER